MDHTLYVYKAEAPEYQEDLSCDSFPSPTVNPTGLAAIHEWLKEHMKDGDLLGPDNINAWATDAEFQMSEGNPPCIELRASQSVSGHTETFTIPSLGIDWR